VGSGFHSLWENMVELNQPASRRTFRWPGAAREMVRTYLNTVPSRSSGTDEHGAQVGLETLISRIAAVSGNPRGACWRFVRQLGVTSKRSYRQWTKAEQQKLLDLIASRSLRKSQCCSGARRHRCAPCCIGWAPAHGWARIGSRNTPWRRRCMFAQKRCRGGLTADCCGAESSRQAGSKDRLLTRKIFAISVSDTAEKSWDTG
jgi:hypothetical protein